MMYQVYFPGRGPIGKDCLEAAGIGMMSGVEGEQWNEVLSGPEGYGYGRIVSWVGENSEVPMSCPAGWKWTPYEDEEGGVRFLIGVNPNDMPSHKDMLLTSFTPGHFVVFSNDQELVVPIAEKLEAKHRIVEGKWVRKVSSKYESFYLQAERIWEDVAVALDVGGLVEMNDDDRPAHVPITIDIADNFVCDALAINYRLFPEAIDALGLIDDTSIARVVISVLDVSDIISVRDDKKKEGYVDIPVT